MKRFLIIQLSVLLLGTTFSQTPSNDPHWGLVWGDEFEGTSVNTSLWNYAFPWGSCASGSALTSDGHNHVFNNGILKLMTYREDCNCFIWENENYPTYYNKQYTSGLLESKNAFKYGYFEIRSKFRKSYISKLFQLMTGEGFSPTFWLFPCYKLPDTSFVKISEIDIYEIRGKTNQYTCNIHYGDEDLLPENYVYSDAWTFKVWSYDQNDAIYFDDGQFHTFGMEWNPFSISFYIDDTLVYIAKSGTFFSPDKLVPMNIIIGNAASSDNFNEPITSNTILPYPYYIDYVRVYNLYCNNETVINDIPDFQSYCYSVKKSISMGSATIFPSDTTTILRATDFIEMRSGFEITGTSKATFIIDPLCDNTIL